MPNSLSPAKTRVTYTEFPDVLKRIDRLVVTSRTDRSLFIRTATQEFVNELKRKNWKPASYTSPADPKANLKRVSYAEWGDVAKVLREYAKEQRLDLSDVIRSAVYTYVVKRKG